VLVAVGWMLGLTHGWMPMRMMMRGEC
jgi:hypothetical protein